MTVSEPTHSSLPVMMAVGAECRHPGANTTDYHCLGAVYIYHKDEKDSWVFFEKILPPVHYKYNQSVSSYYFGGSVSMKNGLLAVGARGLGSAFIYKCDETTNR